MGNLQFGVALPAVTGIAEFARQAEELGFDFLACGEHVHEGVEMVVVDLPAVFNECDSAQYREEVVLAARIHQVARQGLRAALDERRSIPPLPEQG